MRIDIMLIRLFGIAVLVLASLLGSLEAATLPAVQEGVIASRQKGSISGVGYGFLEYVPAGYAANPGRSYPLLIQFGGTGERGNGTNQLERMDNIGALRLIRQGLTGVVDFDDHATGTACIIFAPQIDEASNEKYTGATLDALKGIVDLLIAERRIDVDRIYVTGLSLGAIGTWDYGQRIGGIAALVPCAAGPYASETKKYVNLVDTAIWGFHNYGDGITTLADHELWFDRLTKQILGGTPASIHADYPGGAAMADKVYTAHFNTTDQWTWSHPGSGVAVAGVGVPGARASDRLRLTVYKASGHGGWKNSYDNPDMWSWLFGQSRAGGPAPLPNRAPSVDAGGAQTILVTDSAALDGTVSDPDGDVFTVQWSKVSGPGTASFSAATAVDTSVSFSTPGTYVLQLQATDGTDSDSDTVTITVNATTFTPGLVIDNTDSAQTAQVGTWTTSTGVPGYYGADAVFADPPGSGGRSFSYLPDFTQSGQYDLYVYFPAKNTRDGAVPVVIDHVEGRTTLLLDQRANGGGWFWLGRFGFVAGGPGAVSITTDGTSGYVVADAIGFERVEDLTVTVRSVSFSVTQGGAGVQNLIVGQDRIGGVEQVKKVVKTTDASGKVNSFPPYAASQGFDFAPNGDG